MRSTAALFRRTFCWGSNRAITALAFVRYVAERVLTMPLTDYPSFLALGYDIGSGPTESFCGCLTQRLKGPGMRWDRDNTEAVMSLPSIYYSNQWGCSLSIMLLRASLRNARTVASGLLSASKFAGQGRNWRRGLSILSRKCTFAV